MQLVDMLLSNRVNTFAEIVVNSKCTNLFNNPIDLESALTQVMNCLHELIKTNNKLYIIGNGGSAAVASHALVDFVNVAKIQAQVLHESSLMTCMANDYGYENVYSRTLSTYMKKEDILIAISSSGKSLNICNAAKVAKEKDAKVVTLTGFSENNPLRKLGDYNFWLNSEDYGYVEVGHQFILHNLSDRFGAERIKDFLITETETPATCVNKVR
ncbi:MAG TPA: SIS domain-containing protein [Gammaproteobacteria bacterium]|nr:SIS domain-containing protein [Gammaproteobacteria bacterium]